MKFYRILYCGIAFLFFSQISFALRQEGFAPRDPSLNSCLVNSLKESTRLDRDQAKITCVEKFKRTLNATACANIAKTLEYSVSEHKLKSYCINGLSAKTSFHECFQVASSINYLEGSEMGVEGIETAKWNCIKKYEKNLSQKECLFASQRMKFSYDRERLKYFCLTELDAKKK